MGRYCVAYGCKNRSGSVECKEKGITFHKFPENATVRRVWLTRVARGKDLKTIKQWTVLCSEHFMPDSFRYQPFTNQRIIKPDAVPSIFVHREQKKTKERGHPRYLQDGKSVAVENPPEAPDTQDPNIPILDASTEKGTQTEEDAISALLEQTRIQEEIITELKKSQFRFHAVPNDRAMTALTCFTTEQFITLFRFLKLETLPASTTLTNEDQFFLFMTRLKTGITEEFLSVLFNVSQSSVSRIFQCITNFIFAKVKAVNIWPSRQLVKRTMPPAFFALYPACRVIVDATEFYFQKPSNPSQQQQTFSHYKNNNTVKCLIGISPGGSITFISDVWGGSVSDKELFLKSGLLQKLEAGDVVLSDRGFIVRKELEAIGVKLEMPNFLGKRGQFPIEERNQNKKIAHLRVHVERAIGRLKTFKYFEGQIPIKCVSSINKIVYIAAFISNFMNPLINVVL